MKYTIYAADRSGNSWDLFQTNKPNEALKALENGRQAHPHNVYGVYFTEDPEAGDIESQLEDAVALQEAETEKLPKVEVEN